MKGDVNKLCLVCMGYGLDERGVCTLCGANMGAVVGAPHHLPSRSVLGGKYLTARVLGEGGFGITYLGWDINLEVKVAIKEFYPLGAVTRDSTITDNVSVLTGNMEEFFNKGRDRFVEEARSLAKFHNLPGIVSVRDFFLENGTAYIVMEFVEGTTLKTHLERSGGWMAEAQMLELFRPLVHSLAAVHRAGIIHRDISPDNLMLTPEGTLRLLDFGAARDFNDDNKSLSVLLKPGYAPEEQYRSRGNQGPWTDVYALSATMYRALAGEKPPEALERMLNDTIRPLSPPVSGSTAGALMWGLAVRAENRPQNMDVLYAALYGGAAPAQPTVLTQAPPNEAPRQMTQHSVSQSPAAAGQGMPQSPAASPQPPPARKKRGCGCAVAIAVVVLVVVLVVTVVLPLLSYGVFIGSGAASEQVDSSSVNLSSPESVLGRIFPEMQTGEDEPPKLVKVLLRSIHMRGGPGEDYDLVSFSFDFEGDAEYLSLDNELFTSVNLMRDGEPVDFALKYGDKYDYGVHSPGAGTTHMYFTFAGDYTTPGTYWISVVYDGEEYTSNKVVLVGY